MKITVHRAEGLIREIDTWVYTGSSAVTAANIKLWDISRTAPRDGSYHKCDVKIELSDGSEITQRHDVTYMNPDLGVIEHAERFLKRIADGEAIDVREYLKMHPEAQGEAKETLEKLRTEAAEINTKKLSA